MNQKTDLYIELYKRKEYQHIPIGRIYGKPAYLSPKQLQAMKHMDNPEVQFIGYGGSARSGKTYLECFASIMDCISYPKVVWGLARKELTRLKKSVIITMFKLLDFYGIKAQEDYRYDSQANIIKFNNGSRIMFIDIKYLPTDPLYTRFGGIELTRCGVDESNESEELAITTLASRTGWAMNDVYGLSRFCLETFNPNKGHVYRRYWMPYRDNIETEDKKFIPALPSDNPDPKIQDWIKGIISGGDIVQIERLVKGNFDYDDNKAQLIKSPQINTFINGVPKEPLGLTYISADIALQGADLFVIVVWRGWHILDISLIPKSDGQEVINEMKFLAELYKIPTSRMAYDADGAGGFIGGFLKESVPFNNGSSAIVTAEDEEKNIELKEQGVSFRKKYQNLKTQCVYLLAEKINSAECTMEPDVLIPTNRERLSQELSMLRRDKVDDDTGLYIIKKEEVKKALGRSPDMSDAILMRGIFELKKDINAMPYSILTNK